MVFECGRAQLGGLGQLGSAHVDVSHVDTVLLEPLICLLCLLLVLVFHAFIYPIREMGGHVTETALKSPLSPPVTMRRNDRSHSPKYPVE
jgi:hypothetical protein